MSWGNLSFLRIVCAIKACKEMSFSSSSPTTPTSPPKSADNPAYFGMFNDPYSAAFADPSEALNELKMVARNVENMVYNKNNSNGGSPGYSQGKRRSIRAFVTDSLRRRRTKKDRTQSCGEEALTRTTTTTTTNEQVYENELRLLARSTSLETKRKQEFVLNNPPPKPPERNESSVFVGFDEEEKILENSHYLSLQRINDKKSNTTPFPSHSSGPPAMRSDELASSVLENCLRIQSIKNGNMKRTSNILHRVCSKRDIVNFVTPDVSVVVSSCCPVSGAWVDYFRKVFAPMKLNFASFCSENFTNCQNSSNLKKEAEEIFHSKAQIVILSPDLLKWIYDNPSLVFGNLFNPDKLLALLLGVSPSDIESEHRSSLVHFRQWKLIPVREKSDKFGQKIFHETMSILSRSKPLLLPNPVLTSDECYMNVPSALKVFPESICVVNGHQDHQKVCVFLPDNVSRNDVSSLNIRYLFFAKEAPPGQQQETNGERKLEEGKHFSWANRSSIFISQHALWELLTNEIERKSFSLPKALNVSVLTRNEIKLEKTIEIKSWHQTLENILEDLTSFKNLHLLDHSAAGIRNSEKVFDAKLSLIVQAAFIKHPNRDLLDSLSEWASHQPLPKLEQTLQELVLKRNSKSESEEEVGEESHEMLNDILFRRSSFSNLRSNLSKRNNEEDENDSEDSPYDIPRSHYGGHYPTHYIPMQPSTLIKKNTIKTRAEETNHSNEEEEEGCSKLRRSCSASQVFFPKPEDCDRGAYKTLGSKSKVSKHLNDEEFRPESRQELIYKHFLKKDRESNSDQEIETRREMESQNGYQEFPELQGFTPPRMEDIPIKQDPDCSLFENFQSDLVEMQEKFKNEMLSLDEVEERFEKWKKRPELNVYKGRRQEELEEMRKEWVLAQKLADARNRKESHLWSLMRGILMRKKASSSGGSSNNQSNENLCSSMFKSPEKKLLPHTNSPKLGDYDVPRTCLETKQLDRNLHQSLTNNDSTKSSQSSSNENCSLFEINDRKNVNSNSNSGCLL